MINKPAAISYMPIICDVSAVLVKPILLYSSSKPFLPIIFSQPCPNNSKKAIIRKHMDTPAHVAASAFISGSTDPKRSFTFLIPPDNMSKANGAPKLPARSINSAKGSDQSPYD